MPRPIKAIVAVLAAWLVACELHGLGVPVPTGPEKPLHLAAMGLGAGLCLLRGLTRRRERWAWLALGLGVLAWTLGELYFTLVLWNSSSPPVPSWADAGYLSLPPLIFGGTILLTRERIRGLSRSVWVDAVTAGLAVGAASAAIVFKPVLHSMSGVGVAVATNLTYPVMDLMMLGLICAVLAISGRRLDRRLGVLAFGVVCFWTADTVYLVKSAEGTWVSGGPYDPGWWTIAACVGAAAWMRVPEREVRAGERTSIRVPIAFALIALGVLIAGSFTVVTLPAVVLAGGALVSVMVRLVLTFGAHRAMLERSRDEATTDPLTGLGNRRALAASLQRRLDDDEPASMILGLFDLDGFKNYNDSFGHGAGDSLLQRLAVALGGVVGPHAAFRMGGDEFCVLLPAGPSGTALLAGATRALEERGDGFTITASVGSVMVPEETEDTSDALRLADQRMYAHKRSRRETGTAEEVKRALLFALSQRDPELSDHLDDVGQLSVACARELGCSPAECTRTGQAAELHDVGKMAIPDSILNKPGPLTDEEWVLMRQHSAAGERMVSVTPALADLGPAIRSSHERWDGGGYPDGIAGEQIPLAARIIAVCDSFHAMTSDRSYRAAMSEEVALAELRTCAGGQFDPRVVEAFVRLRSESVPTVEPGAAGAPSPV